jgi:hypothetical protein
MCVRTPARHTHLVLFAVHANSKGVSVKALTGAMDRLMADKKIKVEMFGPPSRQRSKLVISPSKDGGT